jgi:hypothetical protein
MLLEVPFATNGGHLGVDAVSAGPLCCIPFPEVPNGQVIWRLPRRSGICPNARRRCQRVSTSPRRIKPRSCLSLADRSCDLKSQSSRHVGLGLRASPIAVTLATVEAARADPTDYVCGCRE